MSIEKLLYKIVEQEAVIGIVGLGYTGLGLAHDFANAGFKIIGYDIDRGKIDQLLRKESYLPGVSLDNLAERIDEGHLKPTSNWEDLSHADLFIISVPTPLNAQRQPDITFVLNATKTVAGVLKKRGKNGHQALVVLQSTTYPGTTKEQVLPLIEKESGLALGKDFFLAYVPEREDAGNPASILSHIPRICGGVTRQCLFLAKALYEHITVKVHACSSPAVAEAAKSFENTYRLINIAFVDEMKIAFDKMGINIWEVIEAASTKPFGFTPFYPGPGIGGECIPVDPLYLAWRAKQFNAQTTLIEKAIQINLQTSDYVIDMIKRSLEKDHKSIKNSKVLILGVAFKKDVSDIRESPALRVLAGLQAQGAQVEYHDFFVPHLKQYNLSSIQLTQEALSTYDCVAILTDHSKYNWPWICQWSQQIVDSRNATRQVPSSLRTKITL